MEQKYREEMFKVLMCGIDSQEHLGLVSMTTRDITRIEPIVDRMVVEAYDRGREAEFAIWKKLS